MVNKNNSCYISSLFILLMFDLLFLFDRSIAASSINLHGVSPQDLGYYSGASNVFKCKDGSNKFNRVQLNDDFCDCPADGTDEPGTSACPNGKFYCKNAGHIPVSLYSSRVNDGICDCCDGSDEYDGKIKCPNTCWEAGKMARYRLKKKITTYNEGVTLRRKEIEQSKLAAEKDAAELSKLKNEEKILKGLVQQLQDRKEQIEKAEEKELLQKENERLQKEKEEKERKDLEDKESDNNALDTGNSGGQTTENTDDEHIGLLEDSSPLQKMTSESGKDPAWKYATQDPENKLKFKCNFCSKTTYGGVFRAKEHIAGGRRSVTGCKKVPEAVRKEIEDYFASKKKAKENINLDTFGLEGSDDDVIEQIPPRKPQTSVGSSISMNKPNKKGPMDIYMTPRPEVVVKKRKAIQTRIDENDGARKELRKRACKAFARWMYDACIPFNAVNYESFEVAIEAIGQHGPGMKSPSFHEVRVPLLKEEVDETNVIMKDHEKEWNTYGCSLMCDGWVDRKHRTLINFLVNTPRGSFFLESVDASAHSKTGELLYELISKYVERIGPSNIVQVVTDSASNNKLAGKFLEAKYPHLFWTPCAAHCIDLMLEDLFKIPTLNNTIARAVAMNSYIYTRPGVVNILREFTANKELVRPAKTRFATHFITLSRIYKLKANLKKMFISERWTKSHYSKEAAGRKISAVIANPSFWNHILFGLRVAGPLVKVLLLVDGEKKPPMGYIYEAMDRAKEAIALSFGHDEDKYKEIFEKIDNRWNIQLHRPLHAAAYYLNPDFYYSNPDIEEDVEVVKGLYKCIEKMNADPNVQDKIGEQLEMYKRADDLFGLSMAIRQRKLKSPAAWWSSYGKSVPELQKFAIKILSLTCSSSGCERNWSVFEHDVTVHGTPVDEVQHSDDHGESQSSSIGEEHTAMEEEASAVVSEASIDTCGKGEDASDNTESLSKEELGRIVGSRWTGKKSDPESAEADSSTGDEYHEEQTNNTEDEEYKNYESENEDEYSTYDDDKSEDHVDDFEEDASEAASSSYKYESDDDSDLTDISSRSNPSWLEKIQKTVRNILQAVNLFKTPVDKSEAARVRKEYEELNAKLSKIQSRVSSLSQKVKHDFGSEKEFYSLYGQCLEMKENKYVYKVCPFRQATQEEGHSSTRLGSWDKFEDSYRTMRFSNGDKCWNGPDRSLTVRLRCGLKNEIADVDEPSRCEYEAVLSTPALCLEEKLKELQDKLDLMNKEQPQDHDEL